MFVSLRIVLISAVLLCISTVASVFSDSWSDRPFFYKHLVGKINSKLDVEMDLYRNNEQLIGSYFYANKKIPLELSGTIKMDGSFELMEVNPENQKESGIFKGAFTQDDTISGKWNDRMAFALKESYPKGTFPFMMEGQTVEVKESFSEMSSGLSINFSYLQLQKFTSESVQKNINDTLAGRAIHQVVSYRDDEAYSDSSDVEETAPRFESLKANVLGIIQDYYAITDDVKGDYAGHYYFSNQKIHMLTQDFLVVEESYETFMGGAHGSYGVNFYNFDLSTGNLMELSDLIPKENMDAITKLIEPEFRKTLGMKKDDTYDDIGLLVETFALTDNYYLDPQGIGFFYNIYEIAPYALGSQNVVVPVTKDIKALLSPEIPWKKLYK